MKDFKSGLNPTSPENFSSVVITLIVIGGLIVLTILIDVYVIPRLSPENRFNKWWKRHIVDEDPDHL